MWLIDKLAEQHIREAIERGELDDLPGAGKPLKLADDALVPEELRAGYRLLKNAGYLPPELQLSREIADAEALMRLAEDGPSRHAAEKRLRMLELRLSEARGNRVDLGAERAYRARVSEAITGLDSHRGPTGGKSNECPAGDDGSQSGGQRGTHPQSAHRLR